MFDGDDTWLYAVGAVAAGLLLGAVAGLLVRRWMNRDGRRPALRAIAVPASVFLFWLATATGIVFAIGTASPDSLRPIPREIIGWLPNALIAGLMVLAGVAAGIAVANTVGRALTHATGEAHHAVTRAIRWAIIAGAIILALGQLGVRTTILLVLVAGMVSAVSLTLALLAGLGGKDVAAHIAASRTLRTELLPGNRIVASGISGTIVDVNATTIVLAADDGRRMLIPYGLLLTEPFEVTPSAGI